MEAPNWFAYIALFSWPLISIGIYRRMPVGKATIWCVLAGYLLLPEKTGVDLPLVPPLSKANIPNLAAFAVCTLLLGKRIPILPVNKLERWLLVGFLLSPIITSMLNTDPLFLGNVVLRGLSVYDGASDAIRQALLILPYVMARKFLNTNSSAEDMFRALVVASLIYSIPILLEVRLSPQIHRWVYGFFPHMFAQQIRGDGFRPAVFLGHGLWVAFFVMTSVLATATFYRIRTRVAGYKAATLLIYLLVILILCKSMASIIYGVVFMLLILWVSPRLSIKLAVLGTLVVLSYPVLREIDVFPVEQIVELAAEVSDKRAHSLQQRFDQEVVSMEHSRERAIFGWGSWGRNGVLTASGTVSAGADGRWLLTIGHYGWVGYILEYSLMALPLFRLYRVFHLIDSYREKVVLTSLCLMISITLVDCLINDPIRSMTWLLIGIVSGRVDAIRRGDFNSKVSAHRLNKFKKIG